MSTGGPTRAEVPPDTRPGALLLAGLRRGALLVFLPVFAAGQLLAWLTFAATGWYGAWSWSKIGLAVSLTSVRTPFEATVQVRDGLFDPHGTTTSRLVIATGALTIAVLVLAYRAGGAQARGLERRPLTAGVAGSVTGLGFGIPAFVASLPVSLSFVRFGIDHLEPVRSLALVLPVLVAGMAGAIGGLARARERLSEGGGANVLAAIAGGATAFWWGAVLAFVGILLAAALSPAPVGSYARFVDHAGPGGAATLVEHALLLPNQTVLVLATSMGATTSLQVGTNGALDLTWRGIEANGSAGGFLAAIAGSADLQVARFPWWFAGFLLVPLAATVIGGRAAAVDAGTFRARVGRGAAAGVVFAALCALAVWAASITLPTFGLGHLGAITIGASPLITGLLAAAWGVPGGAAGAAIPWPAKLRASGARPR
jgi:hypothetical protein